MATTMAVVFAVALLALVANVSAQGYFACSIFQVTSSATCSSLCDGTPSDYTSEGCFCSGIQVCTTSGTGTPPPCALAQITSSGTCTTTCNGAPSEYNSEGCFCSTIQVCSGGVSEIDFYRAALIAEVGEACTAAVNAAVTSRTISCFETLNSTSWNPLYSMTTSDHCDNTCFGSIFSSVDVLVDAGCVTPATSFSFDDDDDDDDDSSTGIVASLELIAAFQTVFGGLCARSSSNNEYCGNLVGPLFGLLGAGADVDVCNDIVGYGKCLGTLLDVFETVHIEGAPTTSAAVLSVTLNTQCEAVGVTGVAQAAEGTEVPGMAQSSAAGLTALLGATMVAAVAALLA